MPSLRACALTLATACVLPTRVRFTCASKALLRLTEQSVTLWAAADVVWRDRDHLGRLARWLVRKRGVLRHLALSSAAGSGIMDAADLAFLLGSLAGAPWSSCPYAASSTSAPPPSSTSRGCNAWS